MSQGTDSGLIQPATLVKGDTAPVTPTWRQVDPTMALGVAMGASLLIAVTMRLILKRRGTDPRERAFAVMARKLRLSRHERGTVRELADSVTGSEIEAKPTPAALLLSERAFLQSAAAWIARKDRPERAKRVVALQSKVFAPRRHK